MTTSTEHVNWQALARRGLPLLVVLAGGGLCYGLLVRRGIWLSVVGYSVATAERVMQGEVPYRDFLYNYTPGTLWLNAMLMSWFGDRLITISLGIFAFKLVTLVFLFYICRGLTGAWPALAAAALVLAWPGYRYPFAVVPAQYLIVFVVLALFSLMRFDASRRRRWLTLAGAATAVVLLFKHNVGLLVLLAGFGVLAVRAFALETKDSAVKAVVVLLRSFGVLWGGFLAVLLPAGLYLHLKGGLVSMLTHFISHGTSYQVEGFVAPPPLRWVLPVVVAVLLALVLVALLVRWRPGLADPVLVVLALLTGLAFVIRWSNAIPKLSSVAAVAYLPALLFIVVALVQFAGIREGVRRDDLAGWWFRNAAVIIVAAFTLAAYMELYPRADMYHLVRVLPMVFLLGVMLLREGYSHLRRWFEDRVPHPGRSALLCVSIPCVFLVAVGVREAWLPAFNGGLRFADRVPVSVERADGMLVTRGHARMIERITRVIEDNSAPGDYIYSFARRGSGFYLLGKRRNPTRLVWWRASGIPAAERGAVLDAVRERKPALILIEDTSRDAQVHEAIEAGYREIAAISRLLIYARKERVDGESDIRD